MKFATGFLLLFLSAATARAQLAPLPLAAIGSSNTPGYAFRLGDRCIVAIGDNRESLNQMLKKKWGIFQAKDGWSVDASKCISLAECSYVPLIEDGNPVPAYEYQPNFTLNEGEELIAFSANGKKIRGTFSSEDNASSSYSTNQGLRALKFKCAGGNSAREVFDGKYLAITKSDGRRVVGTRYSYHTIINTQTKSESVDLVFEPLLLGSASLRNLPSPTSASVFGYSSKMPAIQALAKWISADFFQFEYGGSVSAWRKAYRIDKEHNDFDFSGCILAPVNHGVLWSNGQSILRFHLKSREPNSSDAAPVDYLDALLDVFGQPMRADQYSGTGHDVVVLRFQTSRGGEMIAGISRDGPGEIAVGRTGIPRTEIVSSIAAREFPLPATRKELRDACLQIFQRGR